MALQAVTTAGHWVEGTEDPLYLEGGSSHRRWTDLSTDSGQWILNAASSRDWQPCGQTPSAINSCLVTQGPREELKH